MISLMTEFDGPSFEVDVDFKPSVEKLMPLRDLLPWKKLNLWDMVLYGHIND